MKKVTFYEEDEQIMAEIHDITTMGADDAKELFRVEVTGVIEEAPVFLKVIMEHPLEKDEFEEIYTIVRDHKIITMSDEDIERNINEDIDRTNGKTAVLEFKCYDFLEAYDCALDLYKSKTCADGNIDVELCEEPSENMRIWLEKKCNEKVKTELDEMTNLIVDMTMKGAEQEELIRAITHSKNLIDAKKYKLDTWKSARENGIDELKEKYQK